MFTLNKLPGIPNFSRLSLVTTFGDSITKSEWGRELDHDFLVSDSDGVMRSKKEAITSVALGTETQQRAFTALSLIEAVLSC